MAVKMDDRDKVLHEQISEELFERDYTIYD